jgi:hypothetical protein
MRISYYEIDLSSFEIPAHLEDDLNEIMPVNAFATRAQAEAARDKLLPWLADLEFLYSIPSTFKPKPEILAKRHNLDLRYGMHPKYRVKVMPCTPGLICRWEVSYVFENVETKSVVVDGQTYTRTAPVVRTLLDWSPLPGVETLRTQNPWNKDRWDWKQADVEECTCLIEVPLVLKQLDVVGTKDELVVEEV